MKKNLRFKYLTIFAPLIIKTKKMKKLLFTLFAGSLLSVGSLSAQEFNASLSGALPIGDAGDLTTFGLNLDANYLFEVADSFKLGATAGYHHYFGESIDIPLGSIDLDDTSFIPLAAAGRYAVSEEFTLGADIGYAIGISPDGNDGGFYYAPKAQYSLSEKLDLVAAYKGISLDGGSFDAITVGIEFGLK